MGALDKEMHLKLMFWVAVILFAVTAPRAYSAPNCEHAKDDDRIALACNIYWEARTESVQGMLAVVAVTMNRVESDRFPDTVHEVVWQNRQFSWTHDGKVDRPKHRPTWKQSLRIARRFTVTREQVQGMCPTATQVMAELLGRPDPGCQPYKNLVNIHILLAQGIDPTMGSLFYHADYVQPYWILETHRVVKIGRHIFYTEARIR
jgi:spore germination cell wall hydrolase CwlJ-like protein